MNLFQGIDGWIEEQRARLFASTVMRNGTEIQFYRLRQNKQMIVVRYKGGGYDVYTEADSTNSVEQTMIALYKFVGDPKAVEL